MSTYALVDLPGLLRSCKPLAIRLDGDVRQIPPHGKRWERALSMVRAENPTHIELLDREGNILAEIAPPFETDDIEAEREVPESAAPWAQLSRATEAHYVELLNQQRAYSDYVVRTSERLMKSVLSALASTQRRAENLEQVLLSVDEQRLPNNEPDEDDDTEDSGLITSLGDIVKLAQLAPQIAPLLGNLPGLATLAKGR